MTHIHITCAAADLPLAKAIADDFRQRGAQVSVSQPSTQKFASDTGKIIANGDALVLLFSPRATESAWVQAEIAWALQTQKLIIPLMVEPTSRVDFFFLISLPEVTLERLSFHKTLDSLAALVHLEPHTSAPPQISPTSLSNRPAEPALENLFDEKDIEGLFFAAAELVNAYPERAVFLYRFVLRLAPNYAGGSAKTFIVQETARIKPDLLLILSQQTDAAINKQDWQRVENLVQDIKVIAGDSPMLNRIKARIAAARLADFHVAANTAINTEKWDELDAIIARVEASGIDDETVAEFRTKTRNSQIERIVDFAYKAIQKKWWDVAQGYAERIQTIAPDNPNTQTIVDRIKKGRIAGYVLDANLLVEKGSWEQVELIKNEILKLDPDSDDARALDRRLKMWRGNALVNEAKHLIEDNDLRSLQAKIAELQRIDPTHIYLKTLQERANELQARAERYAECDAIYQQAVQAQAAGRSGAMVTFMRYIRDSCPDYGDPQGLIGDEITPDSAALVREVNMREVTQENGAGVAFSLDSSLLITANNYGGATIWNLRENKPQTTINMISRYVAFSPDSRIIALAGNTNYLSLWDDRGFSIGYLTGKPNTTIFGFSFSPGGSALAAAFSDGKIRVFSVGEQKQIATLAGHDPYVAYCVAFSPDGSLIASGGADKALHLYEAPDLRKSKSEAISWLTRLLPTEEIPATSVEHLNASVNSLAFDTEGKLLAVGGSDGRIHLIDPTASQAFRRLGGIQAHNGVINSLAFSADSSLLVSASSDTTIKIWDMRNGELPEHPLITLKGHTQMVTSIAFSSDNRYIASSSADHTVRLWGLRKLFDDKPKR